MNKKEFSKAEIEVIRFEKQDIITTSTTDGLTSFTATGADPVNPPVNPPPIPMIP